MLYYKIFETIKYTLDKLNTTKNKKGRALKYSNEQIIVYAIYGVINSIFSLRELEYKINRYPLFKHILEINKAPDYSTILLRFYNSAKMIE